MTNFDSNSSTLLLTLTEAALHLRCTRRHLERYVASGDLVVVRLGRAVRVTQTDLQDFIERHRGAA